MRKLDSKIIENALIKPIKLVDSRCSCSLEDLQEFGFCMCGSSVPYVPLKKTNIQIHVDNSGSIDDDLIREFLELLGELPKKP